MKDSGRSYRDMVVCLIESFDISSCSFFSLVIKIMGFHTYPLAFLFLLGVLITVHEPGTLSSLGWRESRSFDFDRVRPSIFHSLGGVGRSFGWLYCLRIGFVEIQGEDDGKR